jgi:hypothetical protein
MNDTRGDEHTAVERVAKKLLEMEKNERMNYAELRKKYNKIWRKLMDE